MKTNNLVKLTRSDVVRSRQCRSRQTEDAAALFQSPYSPSTCSINACNQLMNVVHCATHMPF